MKKGLKLFLSLLSAVVFAVSMIFFVIGISSCGYVDKNNPEEYPIVYDEELTIFDNNISYIGGVVAHQSIVVKGTIRNVSESNKYIKLYVWIKYDEGDNVERSQSFLVDSFALSPQETKSIFDMISVDKDKSYVEIEYASAVINSVPHRIIENQAYYYFALYIIPAGIFMVAGLICFFIFIGIKPKYVEEESLTSIDTPFIGNVLQELNNNTPTYNEPELVECEYCGSLNKLQSGKCSNCGAKLKKGKRK